MRHASGGGAGLKLLRHQLARALVRFGPRRLEVVTLLALRIPDPFVLRQNVEKHQQIGPRPTREPSLVAQDYVCDIGLAIAILPLFMATAKALTPTWGRSEECGSGSRYSMHRIGRTTHWNRSPHTSFSIGLAASGGHGGRPGRASQCDR